MHDDLIGAIPDPTMTISDTMVTPPAAGGTNFIPVIGETAFSQPTESALRKLDNTIRSNPEALMVVLVEIEEHHVYGTDPRTTPLKHDNGLSLVKDRMLDLWQQMNPSRNVSTLLAPAAVD